MEAADDGGRACEIYRLPVEGHDETDAEHRSRHDIGDHEEGIEDLDRQVSLARDDEADESADEGDEDYGDE